MKSILEQLYDGEICPADQVEVDDPEYLPTWSEVTKSLERLARPEEVDRLDALIGKIAVANSRAGFLQGIRLGMTLAKELMKG